MLLRSLTGIAALFACLITVDSALAQSPPELPAPSPKARAEQRVGVTDLAIDYSSPGVKSRKIWGALVPHDKPWRTGANAPTKLTVSRDFVFAGKAVPAGSYALYTIPSAASWTVVLNSSTEGWSDQAFDKTKDVARVTIKPTTINARERLAFAFVNSTDDATRLDLEWEKLRLPIPITVDTKAHVMVNIDKAVEDAWRPQFASARYLLDSNGDLDKALAYVDGSIAIKATWWNQWVRAQILAKKSRVPEAAAAAEKAIELGKGDRVFEGVFKADVTKALAGWKKKS